MTSPVGFHSGSAHSSRVSRPSNAASHGSRSRRGSAAPFHTASGDSRNRPTRGALPVTKLSSTRPATPSAANGTQARRRPIGWSSAAAGSRNRFSAAAAGTKAAADQSSGAPETAAMPTQTQPASVVAQASQIQAVRPTTESAAADTTNR